MLFKKTESRLVQKWTEKGRSEQPDDLVVEQPLEIVVAFGRAEKRQRKPLAVTMRTPSNDRELTLGFLFSEGLIGAMTDVLATRFLSENSILVELRGDLEFDFSKLERHFYAASSCGVCGKGSLEAVEFHARFFPEKDQPTVSRAVLASLPAKMTAAQAVFDSTGGIHAAALFDEKGELLAIREDVGRHNAFDKIIGFALENGLLPLRRHILLASGRLGFELSQKAAAVGLPVLAAIGAPSSLAVELAEAHGMTVVGFLRRERMNVYAHSERVVF